MPKSGHTHTPPRSPSLARSAWSLHVFWHMSKLILLAKFWQVFMQTLGPDQKSAYVSPQSEMVSDWREKATNGTEDNSWFPAHSLLFFSPQIFFFFCGTLFIALRLSGVGFVCFLRNHRQHFATSTQRHITSCTAPPRSASLCCRLFCISHIW